MFAELTKAYFDSVRAGISSLPEAERTKQAAAVRRLIFKEITVKLTPFIMEVDSVALVAQLHNDPPYYSHSEIANMLGISNQSVSQKLDQARKRGIAVLDTEEAVTLRAFVRQGIILPPKGSAVKERTTITPHCLRCGYVATYRLFEEEVEMFWSLLHQRACPNCRKIGVMAR